MENLQIIHIDDNRVEVLSNAISKYIRKININNFVEGIFVIPCATADKVDTLFLEVVYSSYVVSNKISAITKEDLEYASLKTGIEIKTEFIPYWWYSGVSQIESYDYPLRSMLKSGKIIYDVNGNLEKLHNEYKNDNKVDTLKTRGVVEMQPPVQYKKES